MSRSLTKCEAELERRAEDQILVIRRVIREYNDVARSEGVDSVWRVKKQRELERMVAEYAQTHKTLKRIRKKIGLGK